MKTCKNPVCPQCQHRPQLPCLWAANPEAAFRDMMRTMQQKEENRVLFGKLLLSLALIAFAAAGLLEHFGIKTP